MDGSVRLKGWRDARGQTQKDAAKSLDISQGALSEYEGGKVPRLDVAFKIARLTSGAVPVESWERLKDTAPGAPDLAPQMGNAPETCPAASAEASVSPTRKNRGKKSVSARSAA